MWNFWPFAIGIWFTLLIVAFSLKNSPTEKQVGHTYQELQEMKEFCEKELPRNQECVIVVAYKANTTNKESN